MDEFNLLVDKYLPKFTVGLKEKRIQDDKEIKRLPGMAVEYVFSDNKHYYGIYISAYGDGYLIYKQVPVDYATESNKLITDSKKLYTSSGSNQDKDIFRKNVDAMLGLLRSGEVVISEDRLAGVGSDSEVGTSAWYLKRVGEQGQRRYDLYKNREPSVKDKKDYSIYKEMMGLAEELRSVDLTYNNGVNEVKHRISGKKYKSPKYDAILKCINEDTMSFLTSAVKSENIPKIIEIGDNIFEGKDMDRYFHRSATGLYNAVSSSFRSLVRSVMSNSNLANEMEMASDSRLYIRPSMVSTSGSGMSDQELSEKEKFEKKFGIVDSNTAFLINNTYYTRHISFLSSTLLESATDELWQNFLASL